MNTKRQKKVTTKAKWYVSGRMRRGLALILCAVLVLGVNVPEYGLTVRAARTEDISSDVFGEETVYASEGYSSLEENYSSEENCSSEENYSSWDAPDVSGGDSGSGNAGGAIASGTYKNITWVIDAEGNLTVEGTGDFSALKGEKRAPWYDYRTQIYSVVVRVTEMIDASYMFSGCSGLTSLDLSGFDTSSVTDMSSMFGYCYFLKSLDVSRFDTSSVTDMSDMFASCDVLTSLDLSGFDTSNVTDMSNMFRHCSGLTSLDVSGFEIRILR